MSDTIHTVENNQKQDVKHHNEFSFHIKGPVILPEDGNVSLWTGCNHHLEGGKGGGGAEVRDSG